MERNQRTRNPVSGWIFAGILVGAAAASAQVGLTGRVLSTKSGKVLDSVIVRLTSSRMVTYSDKAGLYSLGSSVGIDPRVVSTAPRFDISAGGLWLRGARGSTTTVSLRDLQGRPLGASSFAPSSSEAGIDLTGLLPREPGIRNLVLQVHGGGVAGPSSRLLTLSKGRVLAMSEATSGSDRTLSEDAMPAGRSLAAGDTLHLWKPGFKAKRIILSKLVDNLADISLDTLTATQTAPAPLFKDPPYDGASDPTIVWVDQDKAWWIFYTARRVKNCTGVCSGVSWVFGSNYGIASSYDGGASWQYRGVAKLTGKKDLNWDGNQNTFWAPEVVYDAPTKTYHMYASITPGILTDWNEGAAVIVHLSAKDPLNGWAYDQIPYKVIHKGIDPVVRKLGDGRNTMWGKNGDLLQSTDYVNWTNVGSAPTGGEGPYVFFWKGYYWMFRDPTSATPTGLWVKRSTDGRTWTSQGALILSETNGTRLGDNTDGKHPSVVLQGDKGYVVYFSEGGNDGTCLQVAELNVANGILSANRGPGFEFLLRQVPEYR